MRKKLVDSAEVELQPKTRDRIASRNSWANIYNENTTLRKPKMLLGHEVRQTMDWNGASSGVNALWECLVCLL